MHNQNPRKKVTKQEFQSNLFAFIAVMLVLVYINLRYSPEHLWFIYPMLGWGMGLFGDYQAWKQTEKEEPGYLDTPRRGERLDLRDLPKQKKPLYREEDLV